MKYSVILLFCVICVVFVNCKRTTYTNRYDKIDLDAIIRNDRLLKNYVDCLMDRGKCRADGNELKKILPDALATGCSKCSDSQKRGSRKIISYLLKNKRHWWNELEAKYDPKKVYVRQYRDELRKEGIEL